MKYIFDNDFIGPGGTAIQAALMCASLPPSDLLGFTCVAGDDQVAVGAHELLRLLKLINRLDIPVAVGADRPLLNSADAMKRWQNAYGKLPWLGEWNETRDKTQGDEFRSLAGKKVEGAVPEHAALFMIECAKQNPDGLTIICGGPMTNIALAARLDSGFAKNVSLVVSNGPTHNLNTLAGRVEALDGFNFLFDPEAAQICLSEPFRSIYSVGVITPSSEMTEGLRQRIGGGHPLRAYLADNAWVGLPMWDELTVAATLYPQIITRELEAWMAVDVGFGAARGRSVVFSEGFRPGAGEGRVTIALDYDHTAFEALVLDSISKYA